MAGRRYFNPRRRLLNLLPGTAFMVLWLLGVGRLLVKGWMETGAPPSVPATMVLVGLFMLGMLWLREPPLTCQGCGAIGGPKDLDRDNPVCPLCGSTGFVTSGRYWNSKTSYFGVVLGADLVSGAFIVDTGGGDCGDGGGDGGGHCGGGDCGGGH